MDILLQYPGVVLFLLLCCLGYGAGRFTEKRHFQSLEIREEKLGSLPVMNDGESIILDGVLRAELVSGSAVISIDYFKRMLALLQNILGGRVGAYESLVERARREALVRMKEHADQHGADMIVNVRLETAAIGNNANQRRQVGSVEAIAYGTAVTLAQNIERAGS